MRVLQVMCVLYLFYEIDSMSDRAACPEVSLRNGQILPVHENIQMVRYMCLEGFTRYGPSVSMCLEGGVWYPEAPMCVKNGCIKPKVFKRGKIHEAKSDKLKGALISFTCDRGYFRKGTDRLLCDGDKWSGDPPGCKPLSDGPVGCDFEDEFLCGWSQDNDDDFDWTRWRGKTPTNDTGPASDYTTNTTGGHYLFLESSAPQCTQDRANLISMIFPPAYATGRCMEFRYHMYGRDVGELSVFVTPANFDTSKMSTKERVFHVAGNQGTDWHLGNVMLPSQKRAFQIVIQGSSGTFYSDIALDDVIIRRCSQTEGSQHAMTKGGNKTTATGIESSSINLKSLPTKERQRPKAAGSAEGPKKKRTLTPKKQRKEKQNKSFQAGKKDTPRNKSQNKSQQSKRKTTNQQKNQNGSNNQKLENAGSRAKENN